VPFVLLISIESRLLRSRKSPFGDFTKIHKEFKLKNR